MLCMFFFFKQKAAYEMRISDWRSDVCSSDLLFPAEGTWRGPGPLFPRRADRLDDRRCARRLGGGGVRLADGVHRGGPSRPVDGADHVAGGSRTDRKSVG